MGNKASTDKKPLISDSLKENISFSFDSVVVSKPVEQKFKFKVTIEISSDEKNSSSEMSGIIIGDFEKMSQSTRIIKIFEKILE